MATIGSPEALLARNKVRSSHVQRVDFFRTKYGPELLVDCAWVRDMPTFIRDRRAHRLTFFDILLVTRGAGLLHQDARAYPVEPGTLVFTTPGQVRRWEIDELDGLCLFFEGEFVETYFNDPLFLSRLTCFDPGRPRDALHLDALERTRLEARLVEMRQELGTLRRDTTHLLRAILYEVLIRLNRLFAARLGGESDTRANPLAFRFRQLVEERVCREHRVAWYARSLAVSPGHLSDVSLRHLGRTAGRFIRHRLLVEAKRRLWSSDASVGRLARELGFADASYFGRFFLRETGMTPAAFRRAGGAPSGQDGP